MYGKLKEELQKELKNIEEAGLFKHERIITSPQDAEIRVSTGKTVLNFCSNNYLGLSSHPQVVEASKRATDTHGFGMSSVRFICGTQDIHKTLEKKIADFLHTEDTILYAAAFDANGGVFEPLLGKEDAIISDALNQQVSLTVCVCARRALPVQDNDMADLEEQLKAASDARFKSLLQMEYSQWMAM